MERVYNFSAGPSMMPVEVLEEIKNDMLNYKGIGYSILEMNHRTQPYYDINNESRELLKKLMGLGDDYEVIFLSGGATSQFTMIPMNLAKNEDTTLYALTGNFANKAYEEGKRFTNAKVIASTKDTNYDHIQKITKDMVDQNAKYLHITVNNTAFGTAYSDAPDTGNVPLVGDMSSIILAKEYDFKKFSVIYAGVQKNIGPAGVTAVIIRKSLITDDVREQIPIMYQYKLNAEKDSIYNTPPVFSVYVLGLMCKWVEKQGGIKALEKRNVEKAKKIYDIIDNSKLYKGTVVNKEDRSPMNVTFTLPTDDLTKKFIEDAKAEGMINLKGHKAAGGVRASLYNAMPIEGVNKLAEFMQKFEKDNK